MSSSPKANCHGFATGYRKLYFSSEGFRKPKKVGVESLTWELIADEEFNKV